MIITKTKIKADSAECLAAMRANDELLHKKNEMLGTKRLSIIHIDQGDCMVDGKKVYYLTFVYLVEV